VYLDQLSPFLTFLHPVEGVLADRHLKGEDADGPDISMGAAVASLGVLGRKVLHGPIDFLHLLLPESMGEAKVNELDGSLDGGGGTLAIITF